MIGKGGRGGEANEENQDAGVEEGPIEKSKINPQTGSLTPGAQNPDSSEIKKETNPNTE
jgi:hypothetical protein